MTATDTVTKSIGRGPVISLSDLCDRYRLDPIASQSEASESGPPPTEWMVMGAQRS
jgi:hypothetical protein